MELVYSVFSNVLLIPIPTHSPAGLTENKLSGQDTRRHPETPPYRCFLSDLTGFERLRRAGPTRTAVRILDVEGDVNVVSSRGKTQSFTQTSRRLQREVFIMVENSPFP